MAKLDAWPEPGPAPVAVTRRGCAKLLGVSATFVVKPAGSRAAARIPSGQTPLRITELSWFVGKHDEAPEAWVTGNPEIRSYANCAACHSGAAQGRYGEHEVRIPGHGGWEE